MIISFSNLSSSRLRLSSLRLSILGSSNLLSSSFDSSKLYSSNLCSSYFGSSSLYSSSLLSLSLNSSSLFSSSTPSSSHDFRRRHAPFSPLGFTRPLIRSRVGNTSFGNSIHNIGATVQSSITTLSSITTHEITLTSLVTAA